MTVQELLDFLEENEVPGDAEIYMYPEEGTVSQRVAEVAISYNDWGTSPEEYAFTGFTGDPEDIKSIRFYGA